MKLENTQKIKKIIMKPKACTRCVLGGDWYTNELEIAFEPGAYYPDYMDVQAWIMENIDGKDLNIEDVAEMVHDYMMGYEPENVEVTDHIKGAKTHFDVSVTK